MSTIEHLESILNTLLQRNLNFQINNKIVKRGKLVLFSVKDYYITFFVKFGPLQKKYEVPFPYHVELLEKNNMKRVIFDYTIDRLSVPNSELFFKLKNITTKANKLHNVKLNIVEDNK
jgi:hypothetical protein